MLTRSQRGQQAGDGAVMIPGSSHHGSFHLLRSRDVARWVLQPLWSCAHPGKDPSCLEKGPSSADRPAEE